MTQEMRGDRKLRRIIHQVEKNPDTLTPFCYLIWETKSTHDHDNRRETENSKIDCEQAHFDALDINFKVATNIHEMLEK